MLRIRLDIEQISIITAQGDSRRAQERALFRKEILSDLASHRDGAVDHLNEVYHQVDERIAKVEGVLKALPDEAQLPPSRSMIVTQEARPTCRKRIHQCSQRLPATEDCKEPPFRRSTYQTQEPDLLLLSWV